MSDKKNNHPVSRIITLLIILSIALLTFLSYKNILGNFFTGIDTVAIIEAGQIRSFDDVVTILNNPLAFGTPMADVEQKCYRPLPALSFSFDYAVWKLNPFGYQLTNLLLHMSVSILVFFFVRLLTKGKQITAWLSAVLFTLNPLLVENIPATVRRFDTITALFILLSLIMFLKHFETMSGKRIYLFFSMFFYGLALLSKEVAVILPFIIFADYVALHSYDGRLSKKTILHAIKGALPYLIMTAVYIAWRSHVLKGIGGYVEKLSGIAAVGQISIQIGADYFIKLLYPVDFLMIDSLFSPFQSPAKQGFFFILLLVLLISAVVFRGKITKEVNRDRIKTVNVFRSMLAAVSAISLICILSYPLISPYINGMIRQAYDGTGPLFLVNEMNSKDFYSVEAYIYKARDLALRASFLLLLLTSACLWATHDTDKIRRFPSGPFSLRITLFLLFWMVLPLGIYLATSVLGRNYLYIAVIPFSGILSIAAVEGFHYTVRNLTKGSSFISSFFHNWKTPGFAAAVFLSASFIWYSPLFHDYGEWKDSGMVTHSILLKLAQALPMFPDDAVLHIYNFPGKISSYEKIIPHAEEVVYMNNYNIKSWLNMNFPGNKLEVIIESSQALASYPYDLKLEISRATDKDVNIIINYY
ncbi:MAG: hypothetical protein HY808_01225 [Nitrospirae bacterium]|nr:hypothetical protein [Nitrospirota bacterium]